MSISIEEVRKLATLSRIKLSEQEEQSLQNEMSSILGYIEQINKADFGGEDQPLPELRNVWREDTNPNETGGYTEKLLKNAPDRDGDYVRVKNIL